MTLRKFITMVGVVMIFVGFFLSFYGETELSRALEATGTALAAMAIFLMGDTVSADERVEAPRRRSPPGNRRTPDERPRRR